MFKNGKPSYYKQLAEMIKKVKAETKWRDIFRVVGEAQKRLKRKESSVKPEKYERRRKT